jgi:TonB family protein
MNATATIRFCLPALALLVLAACADDSSQAASPLTPNQQYDKAVTDAIAQNTKMPPGMWALGLSGVVHIDLILAPSGQIISADVSQSSGTGGLDDLALQQVENTHFPAVPANQPQVAHTYDNLLINYPVHDATY